VSCTAGVIGRIPAGSVEDVEAAVAAAVAAHKNGSWARSTGKQRAVVLRAIAEKVGYLWAVNDKNDSWARNIGKQ
jgi:acyl-CoA reductase-like NAD-dependent aldehyde dehydrogenase